MHFPFKIHQLYLVAIWFSSCHAHNYASDCYLMLIECSTFFHWLDREQWLQWHNALFTYFLQVFSSMDAVFLGFQTACSFGVNVREYPWHWAQFFIFSRFLRIYFKYKNGSESVKEVLLFCFFLSSATLKEWNISFTVRRNIKSRHRKYVNRSVVYWWNLWRTTLHLGEIRFGGNS